MCGRLIVFVSIVIPLLANAQPPEEPSRFIFLPPGLHFSPLKANIQEPRIGVFKFFGRQEMKLDIGNSIDVFAYEMPEHRMRVTAGIDFMAYAFTTSVSGRRLQIDATDGVFGGNISFSGTGESGRWEARLRMLHHSAHLVDGHYSRATASWIDNREPIPFTRDFGELVIAQVHSPEAVMVRYYGGFAHAILVRPDVLSRNAYSVGCELASKEIFGKALGQPVNLFLAYHMSVMGTPNFTASHQIQGGMKFGNWFGKGTTLYVGYYSGRHMFAEYYDVQQTILGAGFSVDFF